jgi:hypothetical protein
MIATVLHRTHHTAQILSLTKKAFSNVFRIVFNTGFWYRGLQTIGHSGSLRCNPTAVTA